MLSAMPVEFLLFGLTLVGVAVLHKRALSVALCGLLATVAYKLIFTGFKTGAGFPGLGLHVAHEWVILANLMLLLVGFAILAHHFEESRLPHALPRFLPDGWLGGFSLLAMVFVGSAFLDNIAAAIIGGVMAKHTYRDKVSLSFVAAIVAAANAGGAGSVIGDTTTTMMWLQGHSPLTVAPAFLGSGVALVVFGVVAAVTQARHAPVVRHDGAPLEIDWARAGVVMFTLACIIAANLAANLVFPGMEDTAPVLGLAIWLALLVSLLARSPDWTVAPAAAKGGLFLVALVAMASLMPVEQLPPATHGTTFGLGLLSSMFDNIPLTALALEQGGYNWALLAYAVGFGGSMIWFGSSAGVAITGMFPEGRSVIGWVKAGWSIPLAYVAGFAAMALTTP